MVNSQIKTALNYDTQPHPHTYIDKHPHPLAPNILEDGGRAGRLDDYYNSGNTVCPCSNIYCVG